MSVGKDRDRAEKTRAAKEALPKCHVCAYHTMRTCSTCKKPACKSHSRRFGDASVKGSWLCSVCDPETKYWEPEAPRAKP